MMFSPHIFSTTLEIHPSCLSKEWRTKFLDELKKKSDRSVDPQKGVILSVEKILDYGCPKAENGKIITKVQFMADSFVPIVEGEVYRGIITLVFQLGLVIEAEGMVKVVIQPNRMPPGYTYDKARNVFTNGMHTYRIGDEISFRIVTFRYQKGEVLCHGSIKDLKEHLFAAPFEPSVDEFV